MNSDQLAHPFDQSFSCLFFFLNFHRSMPHTERYKNKKKYKHNFIATKYRQIGRTTSNLVMGLSTKKWHYAIRNL